MSFLIPAIASLAGSVIGANAQKGAAANAANAASDATRNANDRIDSQEANYRKQIQSLLPYLNAPSTAALASRNLGHYAAPPTATSNNGVFGGGNAVFAGGMPNVPQYSQLGAPRPPTGQLPVGQIPHLIQSSVGGGAPQTPQLGTPAAGGLLAGAGQSQGAAPKQIGGVAGGLFGPLIAAGQSNAAPSGMRQLQGMHY